VVNEAPKKTFCTASKTPNMEFNDGWHVLLVLPFISFTLWNLLLPLSQMDPQLYWEIEGMATFVYYIYIRYKFKLMKCKFPYLGLNDEKEKVKLKMKLWRMMHFVDFDQCSFLSTNWVWIVILNVCSIIIMYIHLLF
jgi:hypothetical protein